MKHFILSKPGDPNSLKLVKSEDKIVLRKDEVLVKHTAVGVNYFDIHFRNGDYRIGKFPIILGMEACGIIEAVSQTVTDYKVGDRVAYALGTMGSYATKRVVNKMILIKPPKEIPDVVVAGSLFKGLMAHTLLNRVYVAERMKRILVHSAAGGIGQFLCSWAKFLGIEVIGTVGHDKKIPFAQKFGCSHVINYKTQDFVKEVAKITDGKGVGIVYDGVGKDTILKSIDCLWPMGICISYGETSGKIPPIDINTLLPNSLYFTRPTLTFYYANRVEYALAASDVFNYLKKGILSPKINTYNFEDLPLVHAQMEKRATVGSQVLIFDK